ncbi:MAG: tetratricopeptide repeat protein [Chthoniobacterales bacterium]
MKAWFWVLVLCGILSLSANAIEINGTVRSATDKYATVVSDSEFIPRPGDKADIFFKLPGSKTEISVANGHVYEITGPNIMVEIEKATGTVAKEQLARITSPNPGKKEARVAPGPTAPILVPAATTRSATPPLPTTEAMPNSAASGNLQKATEHVKEGIAQQSAGDLDGAIASYSKAIEIVPADPAAYLDRAGVYLLKANYEGMFADANKALELGTAAPADAYVIRGTGRAGKGDVDGAIADCNKAIKINPKHALAYNNRANNKMQKRDFDGALADCNKSIALDPKSPLPYYNRGYAYMNKGQAGKALADFNKAIQMQPSYRAELEPFIQRLGSGAQSKPSAGSNTATQMNDLVNPAQKIVGTWQGSRHRKQYFADGTFVTDPHLVPNAPRLRWQIEGDRLTEYYSEASTTVTVRILSISNRQLVTTDDQGHNFRSTRISDAQARKEKANW